MVFGLNAFANLDPNFKLPINGKINIAIFSIGTSCYGEQPERHIYLNLHGDTYMNGSSDAELQAEATCDSFENFSGAGDSVIAEIGNIPLENLDYYSSRRAIQVDGESYIYRDVAPIKENMSYSVIINNSTTSGLMVFRVLSFKNNVITIEYATRSFNMIRTGQSSTFIDYNKNYYR